MKLNDGRHELKHMVSYRDLTELRYRLSYVTKRDKNDLHGMGYRVRSLYFDNYRDKAFFEKIDGLSIREKFRVRIYNDDTGFIRLEKKSKRNGLCYKQSNVISKSLCEELMSGNIEALKNSNDPLIFEMYIKMKTDLLRPKNIVDYCREAFVFPAGNVRITLDYDIRATSNVSSFLDKEMIAAPFPNQAVLEVKYDEFLPEVIRGAVHLANRRSSAFSKYQTSRIV